MTSLKLFIVHHYTVQVEHISPAVCNSGDLVIQATENNDWNRQVCDIELRRMFSAV